MCVEKRAFGETVNGMSHDKDYYEIRLESIGGLGANLVGKLLGELGSEYMGWNAAAFSSYGSEKKGSTVRSYVRWCKPDKAIEHNSPIESPDLLGIFHLSKVGNFSFTAGVRETCRIVVNTALTPEQVRKELKLYGGDIYTIDALSLAIEKKSRLNRVMLGAIAKASGLISLETVQDLVKKTLGKKYPAATNANLLGVEAGYSQVQHMAFWPDGMYKMVEYRVMKSRWGYQNAPIGGVNPHIGSTVSNDLSPSRAGYIPLFLPEKCIHCGLCDTTCPDMVFQFSIGEYRGKNVMMTGLYALQGMSSLCCGLSCCGVSYGRGLRERKAVYAEKQRSYCVYT